MKYPFVKQEGLKDCGVASLLMIIRYYNGNISMEKLRDMTKTDKNGVTAYHIKKASEELGFNCDVYKIDNLYSDIKLPCIAHTVNKAFNHYVVIYEINKDKKEVIIADPASRIKRISFDDFNKIFDNIIICLIPNKKIINENQVSLIKISYNLFARFKTSFIEIVILSFFITLFSIITSFYIECMINNLDNYRLCLLSFVIFIIIYLLKNIMDYIRNNILIKLKNNIDLNLTNELFMKVISLPYRYFKNRTTGEVLTRISDLNIVIEVIIKILVTIILDLLLTLFACFFLFNINYKLSFISLILLCFYILIVYKYDSRIKKSLSFVKEEKALLNSYIVESITGFETIKGLNIENNLIDKYRNKNKKLNEMNYCYQKLYNKEYLFKNIVGDVGLTIIIFIGILLVIKNEISLASLITYTLLFNYFLTPITNIIDLNKDINDAKLSFNRINEILFNENEINNTYNIPFNNISINNLSYSYDDKVLNLNNINLNINNNDKIIITGSSGSGKTTLLKILKKYYRVENNKVFIDNIDINNLNLDMVNKNIKYVSQQEILFTDTLYNNLDLNRKINLDKINEVIKMAHINQDLNLFIEEDGFNLSGGEKQRIILARALLSNFKILILDEALNQVDINLERKILKNILNKYQNKTIIYVSHRKENQDLFNKKIIIEKGNLESIFKERSNICYIE